MTTAYHRNQRSILSKLLESPKAAVGDDLRNAMLDIPNSFNNPVRPKSGFFDLPTFETCTDTNHNMPNFIHIPHGKGYRHVCPSCGSTTVAYGDRISM